MILLTKNPGLFRDFPGPGWKIFQDLFGACECLNVKKKTAFTYNIQSVVHCRKFSMKQNVDVSCSEFTWTSQTGCYTIAACFPCEPLEKFMTLKDIFPGLSRTLSSNFKNFPGPKWFSRTFRVLEFSREKNPGLSRRRGNPDKCTFNFLMSSSFSFSWSSYANSSGDKYFVLTCNEIHLSHVN